MFTKSTSNHDGYHHLTYSDGKVAMTIIPGLGANISSLTLHNGQKAMQVLDGLQDDEYPENRWFKSTFLFPFPNRIRDGKYAYDGQEHQLPINEPGNNNAIHGHLYNRPFELVSDECGEHDVHLTLYHAYDGGYPGYPFPFDVHLKMVLSAVEGLQVSILVTNRGTRTMPLGFGWHPYFAFGHGVDQLRLQLPPCEEIVCDGRNLPTGVERPFSHFSSLAPVGNVQLDACLHITAPGPQASARVYSELENFGLNIWQQTGQQQFDYLQIFTPPGRTSLALEPVTCGIDAFNNGLGLIHLPAGEATEATFGVQAVPDAEQ
jgi:aldose 1-epimerase